MVNNDDREQRIERAVARLIHDLERDHRTYTVAEKRRIMEEREQRRRKDHDIPTGPGASRGGVKRHVRLPLPRKKMD